MRRVAFPVPLAMAGTLWFAALPIFAHHSFTAEFDVEKPVTFAGTVTGIDFYNPHVQIYLDATGEDGKIEKWHIESGPPNQWQRGGLRKAMLAPGTMVKIRAYRARASLTVTLPPSLPAQRVEVLARRIYSWQALDGSIRLGRYQPGR